MVKLTPEIIQQSLQHFNSIQDRELVLRGYKIPIIENLAATFDQFDTIDFSHNDIRKLDGFPYLKRLKSLLLSNNRIVRIGEDIAEFLPNLNSVYMQNNLIQELKDLEPFANCKKLEFISFLDNPVSTRPHYRLFLIHKIPQLRVIDFRRVKLVERESAKKLFKSETGKAIQRDIKKARTFNPGSGIPTESKHLSSQLTPEETNTIRNAIANASSMEEVEKLKHQLRTGNIPGRERNLKRRLEDENGMSE